MLAGSCLCSAYYGGIWPLTEYVIVFLLIKLLFIRPASLLCVLLFVSYSILPSLDLPWEVFLLATSLLYLFYRYHSLWTCSEVAYIVVKYGLISASRPWWHCPRRYWSTLSQPQHGIVFFLPRNSITCTCWTQPLNWEIEAGIAFFMSVPLRFAFLAVLSIAGCFPLLWLKLYYYTLRELLHQWIL